MIRRLAALVTLAASAYFLQRAANPIFEQNARVRQWPAVDVTVKVRLLDPPVRGRAARGDGGDAPSRTPAASMEVEQRHEVAGHVFRTRRLNPRSEAWMPAGPDLVATRESSIVRRGHYDPDRPGQVFLPKAFGFRDYLPVFVWAPLFAFGFGGLLLRKPGRPAGSPAGRSGTGWYRLRPKYSIGYRARGAWAVAVVCNLLLALAAYDYFTGEPRARTAVGDALVCLAVAPGLATAGLAVYYSRMARRVGEPAVSVDALRVRPGERLAVKVELPLRHGLDLEHVAVGLICVRAAFERAGGGRPGWCEREVYADRAERAAGRRAGGGTRATVGQRFRVPPGAEPSSGPGVGLRRPRTDWYVELQFHRDDGPHYRGRFPITVEAA